MAKKQSSKRNSKSADTEAVDENVDKIRDILFGPQMRDYESRVEALEKRLTTSIERAAREVERRIERLDAYTRREVDKLAEQIKNERKDRTSEGKKGATELNELADQVETWFAEVEEQQSQDAKDLRNQQHEHAESFAAQLQQTQSELQKTLQKEVTALSTTKLGREDLAALLAEVAMRLNKDFKLPKG
ncbi:MAG: hypothetical protein KJO31_04260 [Gammaproteobacteria bacterium]|nr:hypothetical protein [Gammaproteobacteria bacterium]